MFRIYLGKVLSTVQNQDNRLLIKILPHMEAIEEGACPLYPFFFRDTFFTGKIGDLMWVLCNDDFSLGYILGLANINQYPDLLYAYTAANNNSSEGTTKTGAYSNFSVSDKFIKSISDSLQESTGGSLNLKNVIVKYWDDNSIHFTERETGGSIIAFSNGSLYIMRPHEFLVKIGKSIFRMNDAGINFVNEDAIRLQSESITLGKQATNSVVVSNSSEASILEVSPYVKA